MSNSEIKYGLRLTLGGASNTPHTVDGIAGVYRPNEPTPVGGPGELSLEAARNIDANPSLPLELVEIPPEKVDELTQRNAEDKKDLRKGIVDSRRKVDGAEKAILVNQTEALKENN